MRKKVAIAVICVLALASQAFAKVNASGFLQADADQYFTSRVSGATAANGFHFYDIDIDRTLARCAGEPSPLDK